MKSLLVVVTWINLCLTTLLFCLVTFYFVNLKSAGTVTAQVPVPPETKVKTELQMYASLPPVLGAVDQNIIAKDARPVVVENYLSSRGENPMTAYSDFIVKTCDQYFPDKYLNCSKDLSSCDGDPITCPALIVAIAECESNICKKIPEGSNNCWGYGIPTGAKKGTEFESIESGIVKEVELLKKYCDQGKCTLEKIGATYAPPSVENNNSWANCVSHFLKKIR